jgi:tRNA-splicing ligase RtcB
MNIIRGIPVFGPPDPQSLEQIERCAPGAVKAALMADHHKGYSVPIGGILAYDGMVSPSGVGYDIACGNKAVRLDIKAEAIRQDIDRLLDAIWTQVSFGVGRKNNERVDHDLFDDPAWNLRGVAPHKQMAREQLGTIGSGNHFVDLLVDADGDLWVGVHFGSRGIGHKTATYFLEAGHAPKGMDALPLLLPVGSALGDDYIAAMTLAGRYAYAGRDWVCQKVASILGGRIIEEVHNHHNFAWLEDGLWVIRKGATPAYPGQMCFVGGSMGDLSYILRGLDTPLSTFTMNSTIHGAGRTMSRTQAKKTITPDEMTEWLVREGVRLRGAGLDEAPQAYKRIADVLAEHLDTVEVIHTLRPIGVLMAGANEFDPFKD